MATKEDDKTIKIKIDGGSSEKESSSPTGGGTGGNQPQQPTAQVRPDPLGYAEQRQAAATGVPAGAPAIDLMNPVQPSNHPQVDLMNPQPAKNRAVEQSERALGEQIGTPLPQQTPFEKGYDEQQQVDGYAELIRELGGRRDSEQETLDTMVAEDEAAQRNERSRKVIAGLGDAISSVVNLVGTMNGAYDQKQVFMEPRLRDVIEQDRQRRYAKIERQRANVQNQINAINNLKMAGAKQRAAERQAAANLAYKAANDAANREQKQREFDRNFDLKVQQYTDDSARKDADQARKERETDAAIAARKASTAQGLARTNSYVERNNQLNKGGSGGGSGRGSGKWYDMNNFQEFQDEIARGVTVNGKRYSSWDELSADRNAMRDPSVRAMLSEINQANTSDKQRAAVQKYIDHAPTWKGKYWGQGVAEYEEPEEDAAPWMQENNEDDKDKAPWL